MKSTKTPTWLIGCLALAALALGPATAIAGDSGFQFDFGGSFFGTSAPCPFKEFPTFESIEVVPPIIDPFEQDLIPVECLIRVKNDNEPVRRAKGNFRSHLYVLDNETGRFEEFLLDSGKFTTDSDGRAEFEFEIPTPLFADGFESGDVSAWSYTRVDPKKKKKADAAQLDCQVGGSK